MEGRICSSWCLGLVRECRWRTRSAAGESGERKVIGQIDVKSKRKTREKGRYESFFFCEVAR